MQGTKNRGYIEKSISFSGLQSRKLDMIFSLLQKPANLFLSVCLRGLSLAEIYFPVFVGRHTDNLVEKF